MSTDDADNGSVSYNSNTKIWSWSGHCVWTSCGSFYYNVFNLALAASNLKMAYVGNSSRMGVLAIGVNGGNAIKGMYSWTMNRSDWTEPVTIITSNTSIASVNFGAYKIVYIPSDYGRGGITEAQNAVLITRKSDLADYINNQGGSLIALGQGPINTAYQWLPQTLTYVSQDFTNVTVTTGMPYISANSTSIEISHKAWHGYWDGPPDWSGVYQVLAYKSIKQDTAVNKIPGICTATNGPNQYCQATVLLNYNTVLTAESW